MNIQLPSKLNATQSIIIDTKSLVVIGANGSGKSRFGSDIELRFLDSTHRISAQKSLTMPEQVGTTSLENATSDFFYGDKKNKKNKNIYRWNSKPNSHLLNDYEKLMVLLHTEEYEDSIKFKEQYHPGQSITNPLTKLDRIKRIWELILPHRKLIKRAGKIETYPTGSPNQSYNASEMSDGERVIFYLIGEVVSVPQNALVIIDEPEMHIHKAVTKHLWDEIELERPDCTFIYLTHDIDFASSRQNSDKIWMKSYNNNVWDYEILPDNTPLPEQLYLDILGSRQPVLFIEGELSSIDYKLLPAVFPDMNIKPLGACSKVIDTTKSFNDQNAFHHIQSFGLIDRDRRTDNEISRIKDPNIWVAEVAEIENFLLLENIVKTVAACMRKNPEDVFNQVKSDVIRFFRSEIIQQAIAHTISRIERIFKNATSHKGINDFTGLDKALTDFWDNQNFKKIFDDLLAEFTQLANTENYEEILRIFNNKGLIPNSNVATLCDLSNKNNAYLNYIISLLKENNDKSEVIRQAILGKIKK
ncbi:DUF4435 domain-containing protein [Mucilaginibacter lappiensis]|uniref:DUF4435 domain-containing protein n=1 Tax=Mucilaginibacter lappiensis TaxID=354630 RepID=UPI003D239473